MTVERNFPLPDGIQVYPFLLCLLLIIISHFISGVFIFHSGWMIGVMFVLSVFSFGRELIYINKDIQIEKQSVFSDSTPNCLLLEIITEASNKKNSLKIIGKIQGLSKNETCYIENEKIIVYADKNADQQTLKTGNWILFDKRIQPVKNIRNSDFDYREFCRQRHIYNQVFLRQGDYLSISPPESSPGGSFIQTLRKKLEDQLKLYIGGKLEQGFLEALVLGYTDDLDPDLLKSYANTGVIHIIAISGLHLTLICQILLISFSRLGNNRLLNYARFFAIVLILWGYTILSGSSPSALRAATMFTLSFTSKFIFRNTDLYSALAISAFILLVIDPNCLSDPGFQLSYAAVLSLGLFSNSISRIFKIENKILAGIWQPVAISLAAQILTTPISIYYFHQFPCYFMFANLLAVPLSGCILVGGILLILSCGFPGFSFLLGRMVEFLIKILNNIIHYLASLPGAVIQNLHINSFQVIFLYICGFGLVYRHRILLTSNRF